MGGGSSSLTSMSSYSKSVAEAMSKTMQKCKSDVNMGMNITIKGNYNVVKNVRMVQSFKLSSGCNLDDKNVADVQQAVSNQIKQQSEAANVAFLGALGSSSSTNTTDIHNEVVAKITRETIQEIVNSFNMKMDFYLDGNSNIVEDISMEQSAQVLQDNCLAALSKLSSIQAIENVVESKSTAKQTNPISEIIDSIGSIFTSMGILWVIVILACVGVVGFLLYNGVSIPFLPGGSDDDEPERPYMPQPYYAPPQGYPPAPVIY